MDLFRPDIGADRPGLHPDLGEAARSVHEQFDEVVGQDEVDQVLDQVAGQFTDAPIRAFVPLFVQRFSNEELSRRAAARSSAPAAISHIA
ncbi:three-helix bundle dimerization domain-containing protein [Angustibacter sp. McL0619]|uniref:three-helix bundle dimerization domain-containing protein n=1 Tax=Angustibacter sp. McL0619 TaxID=3415676 RepID=UPI003CF0EED2